jgi:hypothetical protein
MSEQQQQIETGPPRPVGETTRGSGSGGNEETMRGHHRHHSSGTMHHRHTKQDSKVDGTGSDADVNNNTTTTSNDQTQPLYMASCVEYVVAETVRYYRDRERMETGPPVAASLGNAGFEIGKVLGERLSREKGPMASPLEVMKWVCKEFWKSLFCKGIDNLRTNHKGTFVLRDTQFIWTRRLCQNVVGGVERLPNGLLAVDYLVMPCGILRGVLSSFGIDATVTADATALPQCDFTVVLV